MSSMPVPVQARRIRAGDVITVHPDPLRSHIPIEYHVTRDAYEGEFGAWHIEYRDADRKVGELVIDTVTTHGGDTWVTVVPGGSGLLRQISESKGATR